MTSVAIPAKGFALPLVLIVIALLTVLSMGLSQMARNRMADLQLRKNIWADEKAAQDIVQQSVYALLVGQYSERELALDGSIIPLDGRVVTLEDAQLRIQDEAGLMSLAFYDRKMFNRLLKKLTDSKTASRISAELSDWIDKDNLRQFQGMEAANYISEGLLQSPRNAPIRSLGELLDLPSMTPELFNGKEGGDGLIDLVAAGGASHFNVATAPEYVLSSVLDLSVDVEAKILAARNQKNWAQVLSLIDRNDGVFNDLSPFSHGSRYRILITATNGNVYRAQIRLTPYRDDRLFAFMEWHAPYYKSE